MPLDLGLRDIGNKMVFELAGRFEIAGTAMRTLLGVDVVFGYPGGAIMPFYHALPEYPALRHVLVRHEQAAAHAADGFARASGRPGVCVATSGPGATNLVTGLATAHMDSSPVVAITGQVSRNMIGRDAFQETDIIGITQPITKHNVLVEDVAALADTLREALAIAQEGRVERGAPHVDGDEVGCAGGGGRDRGAHHTAGGPGPQQRHGPLGDVVGRHHATGRLHDQDRPAVAGSS